MTVINHRVGCKPNIQYEGEIYMTLNERIAITIVKASTSKGKRLLSSAIKCCWSSLGNLYNTWSKDKQHAFDYCWQQYCRDETASAFGVGCANTFGFSASWLCKYDGKEACRLETRDNSYLILLDE